MESFLIFALQFILRQKSVKGNVTITILYLKVFHTHTHNLYFTDFTLKLFIVIFCYCPVSLCVSGCCYGRSTTPPFPGAHKFQSLGRLHFTDKKYFLRMLRRAQKHWSAAHCSLPIFVLHWGKAECDTHLLQKWIKLVTHGPLDIYDI